MHADSHASPLGQGHVLQPRSARSLRPVEPCRLHILQGRVWLTLSGAGASGDHFLAAGDSLALPAGCHAVMEPYPAQPVRWACTQAHDKSLAPARVAREAVQPVQHPALALGS
jgi:hypothetical protein